MARYNYKCMNPKCENFGIVVVITKPMMESSNVEHCELCKKELQRDYSGGTSIVTGDGVKH